MTSIGTTIGITTATLLAAALAGCGGSTSGVTTSSVAAPANESAAASATPNATAPAATSSAGQVTITFATSEQSFELANCVSGSSSSVQGSGSNDEYSLMIDVQDGAGPITLSTVSDMIVFLDGTASEVQVSSDGTFTITGQQTSEGAAGPFTVTGTCGMVIW